MGTAEKHPPAQFFAGLLVNPAEGFERVREALAAEWGEIDLESETWPFDFTGYYEGEMGTGLLRRFLAFRELRDLDGLHRTKLASNRIEERLAAGSPADTARPVNVDPGYIHHGKLVLFTTKDYSHRIYIADGIFAEITLNWTKAAWHENPWTYPDYRSREYREFFAEVRRRYREKLDGRRG